jgi:hypothetical protein
MATLQWVNAVFEDCHRLKQKSGRKLLRKLPKEKKKKGGNCRGKKK